MKPDDGGCTHSYNVRKISENELPISFICFRGCYYL